MKGIIIEEPGSIEIKDFELGERQADEAIIKIKSVGICGSDTSALLGKNPTMTYPRVMGHEAIGVIEEIAADNRKQLKVGDRVVLEPYLHCGTCQPCKKGAANNCETIDVIGVRKDGAMVEKIIHPVEYLYKLPDTLPDGVATMVEPLSISLHGVHRAKLIGGEFVVIFGGGTIGFLAALICKAYGARPILVDLVDEKIELAQKHGIPYTINLKNEDLIERVREITNGAMAAVVLECSGSEKAMYDTIDVAAYSGRIVFVGWAKGNIQLNQPLILKKELQLLGSRNSYNEFEECIELLDSKKVDVASLIEYREGFEGLVQGFHEIIDQPGKYLKVIGKLS